MKYPYPILCVGGPLSGQRLDELPEGYRQYKSEWEKETFIWVWKELLEI